MVGKITLNDLEEILKEFLEESEIEYDFEFFRDMSYPRRVDESDIDRTIFAISTEINSVSEDLFVMDEDQFDNDESVVYDEVEEVAKENILDFLYHDGDIVGLYLGYSPWIMEAYKLNLVPVNIHEDENE